MVNVLGGLVFLIDSQQRRDRFALIHVDVSCYDGGEEFLERKNALLMTEKNKILDQLKN